MQISQIYSCLQRIAVYPSDIKQRWANDLIKDYYVRQGRVPVAVKSLLVEVLSGLPSFKYNHNHDPENGQFVSGPEDGNSIDDPPIKAVYPVETVLAGLSVGEGLAVMKGLMEAGESAVEATMGPVEDAMQAIEDYLGGPPDRTITNPAGDVVVMRGNDKIRFDINNPGDDAPHFHIETQNSSGDWVDASDQHRYYFQKKE